MGNMAMTDHCVNVPSVSPIQLPYVSGYAVQIRSKDTQVASPPAGSVVVKIAIVFDWRTFDYANLIIVEIKRNNIFNSLFRSHPNLDLFHSAIRIPRSAFHDADSPYSSWRRHHT